MAPTGITFQDVQTWAAQDFSADFKHLPDAQAFNTQFNIVRGYNHDKTFKSLAIGSTYTKTKKTVDIIAWLASSRIQIGYIGNNRTGESKIRHMVSTEENGSSWSFKFPFNFIPLTQSETQVASFNAMLRYYFLAKGWSRGVIDESEVFNRFVARFPHACRAVANMVLQTSGLDQNSYNTVYTEGTSRIPRDLVDYQPLYQQRTPCLFEQDENDPPHNPSYTVLSSPAPSPPPIEDRMTPQNLDCPLEMHTDTSKQHPLSDQTRSRDPQQGSSGGDQMVSFNGLNDTSERDEFRLQNEVEDLNTRLLIAEGLARDAESAAKTAQEEAKLWRKRYEELESFKIKYEEMKNYFRLQK